MTAINSNRAIRGPVTAVPVVAGKGVRLVADTENNRWVVEADETVLYSGLKTIGDTGSATYQLSESPLNFQYIKVYCCALDGSFTPESSHINQAVSMVEWDTTIYTPYNTFISLLMNGQVGTSFAQHWISANISGIRTTSWSVQGSLDSGTSNSKWFHIYKIVGINRIASN